MRKIIVILGKQGTGKTTLLKEKLLPTIDKRIIYDTLGEYDAVPDVLADDIHTLCDLLECGENKIRFLSDNDNDFDRVCQLIYEPDETIGFSLVVDEIDLFCNTSDIPEFLQKIIRYGRHRNVSLYCISRRPADIPRLLTSQATHIITFAQHEPRDIDYLSKFISDADQLQTLKNFEFICYETATGQAHHNIVPV